MGIKAGYSSGKKNAGANRGGRNGAGDGTSYSQGKDSSIAKGIGAGKSGSSKVDVGYSAGQKYGGNCSPDPKNRSKPFSQGGRS